MRRWAPTYLLLLCALTVGLTWPLMTGLSHLVVNEGDPLFLSWTLAWDCHALTSHPLDLFHTNIFHPHRWTLAFSEHSVGNALMVFPFAQAGASPVFLYNLALLLSFPLSGFLMFLLVRDLTRDQWAAAVTGILYAFSHYRFGRLDNLPLISMQGLPLFLLGLHRGSESGRWRDLLCAVAGFAWLALSCGYNAYLTAVAGLVFIAWFLYQRRGRVEIRLLKRAPVAVLLLALLIVPVNLPYWKVRTLHGFARDRAEVELYSAHPSSYLRAPPASRVLGEITDRFHQKEGILFPGLLVLGLAGAATLYRRTDPGARVRSFYVALVLAALWCSLGPKIRAGPHVQLPSLYHLLNECIPGFDAMRVPARFGMLVSTGLTVLAGYGVAATLARIHHPPLRIFCAGLLMVLAVGETWCAPIKFRTVSDLPENADRWLASSSVPGAVVYLPLFDPTRSFYEARRMIGSTRHWRPIVNGYSGFWPPDYTNQAARLNGFPNEDAVALMKELGVRYAVNEWTYYTPEERADILAHLPPTVQTAAEFPESTVWEITP